MCEPITAMAFAGLALGAIGGAASYESTRKATSQAQDRYAEQTAIQREQINRSEAIARRKYEAEMKNYRTAVSVYQENKAYLDKLVKDPTGHPDYASFKSSLDKQFKGARKTLSEVLRRRGRTGGIQDEALADLQTEYEGNLTTFASSVQSKARQQRLGLAKPPVPYLGGGQTDWAPYLQAASPPAFSADLSGFGSMLALANTMSRDTKTTDSTLAKTGESVAPYNEMSYQELMDWAMDYNMGERST